MVIPPMEEKALPNLYLDPEPKLTLTDKEITDLYAASPSGVGKILKNQAEWNGNYKIAQAAVDGYRTFIINIFTEKKK